MEIPSKAGLTGSVEVLGALLKLCVRNKVWLEAVFGDKRESWAGHVARIGLKSNSAHMLKFVIG